MWVLLSRVVQGWGVPSEHYGRTRCVCCLGPALIYRSVLTLILTSLFPFLAQYTLSRSFTCSFYWFLILILAKIYYAYYNKHREEREIQELLGCSH